LDFWQTSMNSRYWSIINWTISQVPFILYLTPIWWNIKFPDISAPVPYPPSWLGPSMFLRYQSLPLSDVFENTWLRDLQNIMQAGAGPHLFYHFKVPNQRTVSWVEHRKFHCCVFVTNSPLCNCTQGSVHLLHMLTWGILLGYHNHLNDCVADCQWLHRYFYPWSLPISPLILLQQKNRD
jgi:hypothetical protein